MVVADTHVHIVAGDACKHALAGVGTRDAHNIFLFISARKVQIWAQYLILETTYNDTLQYANKNSCSKKLTNKDKDYSPVST